MKKDVKEEKVCKDNCKCDDKCSCEESKKETCKEENCACDEKCTCGDECECTPEENCGCGGHCKDKKDKKKDANAEKLALANARIAELEDLLLREKAELINYRKRREEEVSRMLKYSNEDMAKALLPIVDNFERAIKMDDENLDDDLSKFLAGFKMIYCNFVGVLEKNGVKAIDGANKPFDPAFHQAIMTEAREGVEPEMVLEVLQKGYLLKDKVIRPAMVKVSE
jgi:molecular chaperone GrpE